MRPNIRIKVDFSKIFNDARRHSWLFVDSTKIHLVKDFESHIQSIFKIERPFHLLSKLDDNLIYLPSEEDIRILENNDTVVIVPGSGIDACEEKVETKAAAGTSQIQNGTQTNGYSEQSQLRDNQVLLSKNISSSSFEIHGSHKMSLEHFDESVSDTVSDTMASFYKTALRDTSVENTAVESKITEDNFTEDNSVIDDSVVVKKRKRTRRSKKKKNSEIIPESDVSAIESSSIKKPKIINSVTFAPTKHIRFEDNNQDKTAALNDNSEKSIREILKCPNKDLSKLLSLGSSSTPLTFDYRKPRSIMKSEPISETKMLVDENPEGAEAIQNNSITSKAEPESQVVGRHTNSASETTISFKILKLDESYSPKISSEIIAQILDFDTNTSEYTLRVLHGKDQLELPEGKFSLPDDMANKEENNVVVLDKSKLFEVRAVKAA